MSLRFAAAGSGECLVIARILGKGRIRTPANDHGDAAAQQILLRAALRHFAEHGLSAADRARQNAEAAFFAGNRQAYQHWWAICRLLDRRMADGADLDRIHDRN